MGQQDLDLIVSKAEKSPQSIYLFIGPAPIIKPMIDRLINTLLSPDILDTNLEILDGETATGQGIISAMMTRSFFPGRKVVWARRPEQTETLSNWLNTNKPHPQEIVLILEMDNIDRRSKLFKYIKANGSILNVEPNKQHSAKNIIQEWLHEQNIRIESKALELFCNQVGEDDLVAIKSELEKLIAGAENKKTISVDDVKKIVVRHREEALYELSQAIGNQDISQCLASFYRLRGQGVHQLALLSYLANHVRRLAVIREALEKHGAITGTDPGFNTFKRDIWPRVQKYYNNDVPLGIDKFHPYAQYKHTVAAMKFNLSGLLNMLVELSQLDIATKRSDPLIDIKFERFLTKAAGLKNN